MDSKGENAQVYMIGIWHDDLRGENRLYKLLDKIRPDVIAMEGVSDVDALPREDVNYATRNLIKGLLASGEDRTTTGRKARLLKEWLMVQNYEIRAVKHYASEYGIPVHMIEDGEAYEACSEAIDKNIPQWFEEIMSDLVSTGTISEHQKMVDRRYDEIRHAYNDGNIPACLGGKCTVEDEAVKLGLIGERDVKMSPKLREFAESNPGKKIAFVSGVAHGLDSQNGNTVYSQIADLVPRRMVLSEADELGVGNGTEATYECG